MRRRMQPTRQTDSQRTIESSPTYINGMSTRTIHVDYGQQRTTSRGGFIWHDVAPPNYNEYRHSHGNFHATPSYRFDKARFSTLDASLISGKEWSWQDLYYENYLETNQRLERIAAEENEKRMPPPELPFIE